MPSKLTFTNLRLVDSMPLILRTFSRRAPTTLSTRAPMVKYKAGPCHLGYDILWITCFWCQLYSSIFIFNLSSSLLFPFSLALQVPPIIGQRNSPFRKRRIQLNLLEIGGWPWLNRKVMFMQRQWQSSVLISWSNSFHVKGWFAFATPIFKVGKALT